LVEAQFIAKLCQFHYRTVSMEAIHDSEDLPTAYYIFLQ